MNTKEMSERLAEYVTKLINLFNNRNIQYADESIWCSNFIRNAELCKVFRLKEILEKPYGQSIRYVIDKIDRTINGVLQKLDGKNANHIGDSIDDAVLYLAITKYILIEEGLINE